jgi:hypothetical protein
MEVGSHAAAGPGPQEACSRPVIFRIKRSRAVDDGLQFARSLSMAFGESATKLSANVIGQEALMLLMRSAGNVREQGLKHALFRILQ